MLQVILPGWVLQVDTILHLRQLPTLFIRIVSWRGTTTIQAADAEGWVVSVTLGGWISSHCREHRRGNESAAAELRIGGGRSIPSMWWSRERDPG